MKRKLVILLAAAMLAQTGVSALPVWGESVDATTENEDYCLISEEGAVIQGDGYSMEIAWCGEEGKRVFGRIYYPADFDSTKQYTTVVLNHGGGVNADFWDKCYAPELAKQGYVCYTFDCRSATEGGRGVFSDPTEDGVATVATYSEDLNAAMDLMESKDYVDKAHLYLMGQSMGGVTVQNVASARSDEVAGMIVLYGSVSDDNKDMLPDYESVKENPYHNGEVLFVQGAQDAFLPVDRTLENMSWYETSSIVYINTAFHGFGVQSDRPANICIENVIDYLKRTENASDEMPSLPSISTEEDLLADEEGYTASGEKYSFTVHYCGEEGSKVFGRMYYPADFDETKTYPTLIVCHGGNGNADSQDKVYCPTLAEAGYICYAIDCRSEASGGRGSYGDPTESGTADIVSYSGDVKSALDYVESLGYVNKDSIYLMGGSMGGATCQVVASQRADEIAGLIILSGSLGDDMGTSMYPDYEEIKANPYDGEVLFVQGLDDQQCILSRTLENMEWYPNSSLTAISGMGHGYGYQMDRPAVMTMDNVKEFLYRTLNHIGEKQE